ncbi:hypothetical protein ZWY2020_038035 [Hordeum vulgare]|nr:hypothetical protein ZWY2020_038035 [Hordeum vulgare]
MHRPASISSKLHLRRAPTRVCPGRLPAPTSSPSIGSAFGSSSPRARRTRRLALSGLRPYAWPHAYVGAWPATWPHVRACVLLGHMHVCTHGRLLGRVHEHMLSWLPGCVWPAVSDSAVPIQLQSAGRIRQCPFVLLHLVTSDSLNKLIPISENRLLPETLASRCRPSTRAWPRGVRLPARMFIHAAPAPGGPGFAHLTTACPSSCDPLHPSSMCPLAVLQLPHVCYAAPVRPGDSVPHTTAGCSARVRASSWADY